MTIEIYPSLVADAPAEVHEWQGSIAGFLDAQGSAYNTRSEQPIVVIAGGVEVPCEEWGTFYIGAADAVQIRVVAHGWLEVAYAVLAAFMVYSLTNRPNLGVRNDTPQGRSLNSAEATANVAKLNQAVPELAGRHIRRPDYLTPPRRYFADPRTQYLETLLCIGPGKYAIDGSSVKVGNTPLAGLVGAEFHIYEPGQNVAAHGMHGNWYTSPEVGGTSAGTAGLELSSEPATTILPPAGIISFEGKEITAPIGWPDGFGPGTEFEAWITLNCSTLTVPLPVEGSVTQFTASFKESEPLSVGKLMQMRALDGEVINLRVLAYSDHPGDPQLKRVQFEHAVSDVWQPFLMAAPPARLAFRPTGRRYRVASIAPTVISVDALRPIPGGWEVDPTWVEFPSVNIPSTDFLLSSVGGNVYGKWSGPYVACPAGESSQAFDLDFFFPSGLGRINDGGDLETISIQVEIQYRPVGSVEWVSFQRTYAAATLDQIGFTERVSSGAMQRMEFRVRRASATSTDTRTNDKVQWYGMRTLLQSPTSYPRWTTIAIRIKGLGDIGASSENQINLIATRILPTLQSNGAWGPAEPTRDISAFARYIANSVGYTDDQLDAEEFLRLHNIWTSRGETVDHIFNEGTVKNAIDTCFAAGMSELTVEDGLLRPVRDGVRTAWEQSYSAQNTTGKITRTFTSQKHDDNDGVQIEYIDENESYTTKTVDCLLPGSPGLKLEKIKLQGVVDRARAWRIGMRRAREIRYQRWSYVFSTEMDALNSLYGGYIAIIPDIPDYGQSALITRVQGQTLTLSELPEWKDGSTHVVAWRTPEGKLAGPFAASKGASEYEVIATIPGGTQMPIVSLRQEPPHAYFGTSERWVMPALVRKVSPDSESKVKVQAVNYDARVYADDNSSPG